ncbi:MAG: hypothetical protein WCP39_04390 [Chlamydiota bacterium]
MTNPVTSYKLPDYPDVPAFSNLVTIPQTIYTSTNTLVHKNDTKISKLSASCRLGSVATKITYWVCKILSTNFTSFTGFISSLNPAIITVFHGLSAGFGIGTCTLEFLAELVLFIPHCRFLQSSQVFSCLKEPTLSQLKKSIVRLQKEKTTFGNLKKPLQVLLSKTLKELQMNPSLTSEELQNFQKNLLFLFFTQYKNQFFTVSKIEKEQISKIAKNTLEEQKLIQQCLNRKKSSLIQRIGKLHADELGEKIISLCRTLKKTTCLEASILEAKDLYNNLQIQTKKVLIFHLLGFLTLVISVISFAALCVASGGTVSLILVIIGIVYGCSRWVLSRCFINTHGWTFQPSLLVPDCVKKLYHRVEASVSSFFMEKYRQIHFGDFNSGDSLSKRVPHLSKA